MRAASSPRRGRLGAPGGRHRRPEQDPTPDLLIEQRDRTAAPHRRLRLPAPSPSSLVGIAVLVLIGVGVVHLSGSGSAVPLEDASPTVQIESADAAAPSDAPTLAAESDAPSSAPASAAATGQGDVVVHVSGQVAEPGVVTLPVGSRVDDAVRAAGGATGEADLAALNLARVLVDGEQVHVPEPGEAVPTPPTGGSATTSPSSGGTGADDGSGATGTVDLNAASAAELEDLPGVGPAIAQRIVDHREANGPFRSVDDLLEVSGIGPATLERIRPAASV